MLVAIDGPSGSGKSTLASSLGVRLGLPVLETGRAYRELAVVLLSRGFSSSSPLSELMGILSDHIERLDGSLSSRGTGNDIDVDGSAVLVARIASIPHIRELLNPRFREWVHEQGCSAVVVGRDAGTVVFPNADFKIFLTASAETRAARRAMQSGVPVGVVAHSVHARDTMDQSRAVAPLAPAMDAVVIDTTARSIDDVLSICLSLIVR